MMIEHLPGEQYTGTHAGGRDICGHKHTMSNFDSLRQLVTFILRQVHKVDLAKPDQMLHPKLHVTLSVVRIPSSLQWHFWFQKWPWYQCRKRSNIWNYLN